MDAKTIFKYFTIQKIRPDIQIITELVSPDNINFLIDNHDDYLNLKKYGYYQTKIYASGEIYISSIMDSLLAQSYYNMAIIEVIDKLVVGKLNNDDNDDDLEDSYLSQLKTPSSFIGKKYIELFEYLTDRHGIIPLAVYRYPKTKDETNWPFVTTNPKPDFKLRDSDMIMVLTQILLDSKGNINLF